MVEFGDRLRELRINEGLTQQQLGDLIGVTKSMVSYYEVKERTPAPATLIRIAQVFHVTADYLLDMEDRRTIDIEGLDARDEEIIRRMVAVMRKLKEEERR